MADKKTLLIVSSLFVIILLSRLPFAYMANERIAGTPDEIQLTLNSVDRFLGVPHTSPHWPGAVNQLLFLPLFAADYIVQSKGRIGPSGFLEHLGNTYRSPWHALWLMRFVVALVSSLGLAFLFIPLSRRTGSKLPVFLGLVVIAMVPAFWRACYTGVGDGVALGFCAMCVASALMKDKDSDSWVPDIAAGICMGLALAARNVMVPVFPLAAAILMSNSRKPIRSLFVIGMIMCLAFVAACPYVWMEPVRWAKATFGNYAKGGEPAGLLKAASTMVTVVPTWLCAVLLFSTIRIAARRRWILFGGVMLAILAVLLPTAGASQIRGRYFHAMILVAGVLGIMQMDLLKRLDAAALRRRKVFAAIAAVIVVAAICIPAVVQVRKESRCTAVSSHRHLVRLREEMDKLTGKRVLVPEGIASWVMDYASSESILRMAECAESAILGAGSVIEFVEKKGIAADLVAAMPWNFVENDQVFAARMRMMAVSKREQSIDIQLYVREKHAGRSGLSPMPEALESLHRGDADAMIIRGELPEGVVSSVTMGTKLHIVTTAVDA